MRFRNPAVVPNPGAAGIGVIHALALGGVDIIAVGRRWPPLLGRFSNIPRLQVTYRADRGETLADALVKLADRFDGKAVLFPAIDTDLEVMINERARLEERYHIPAAPHLGHDIEDKNWQYDLAERTGTVATPRNARFNAGEFPDVRDFRFPLIIKPTIRTHTSGWTGFRLRILENPSEVEQCLAEVAREYPGRPMQIAENIPGEPDQLYTVGSYSNAAGKVLRSYTGRKITQWPYYHGVASVSESTHIPEEVVHGAAALLDAAKFHGISQVELKHDVRDGRYKLLEINARSWFWIKLAAYAGVNLPLIQYYDLTGDPRLADALAVPQRYDNFWVHDLYVTLNDRESERERIVELSRTKQRVSSVDLPEEDLLRYVYRATGFLRARFGIGGMT